MAIDPTQQAQRLDPTGTFNIGGGNWTRTKTGFSSSGGSDPWGTGGFEEGDILRVKNGPTNTDNYSVFKNGVISSINPAGLRASPEYQNLQNLQSLARGFSNRSVQDQGEYQKLVSDNQQAQAAYDAYLSNQFGGRAVKDIQSNVLGNFNSLGIRQGVKTTGDAIDLANLQSFLASQNQAAPVDPNNTFYQRSQGTLPAQTFSGGKYIGTDPNAPENMSALQQAAAGFNQGSQVGQIGDTIPDGTMVQSVNVAGSEGLSERDARNRLLGEAASIQRFGSAHYDEKGNLAQSPRELGPQIANASLPPGFLAGPNGEINFDPNVPRQTPQTQDEFYGIPNFAAKEAGYRNETGNAQVPFDQGGPGQVPDGAIGMGASEIPTTPGAEDALTKQLMESLTNEEKLKQANLAGQYNIRDQPIAQSFITGQQASMERRLGEGLSALGVGTEALKVKLASEQARRASALDASKFSYQQEMTKKEQDLEQKKFEEAMKQFEIEQAYKQQVLQRPVELSAGATFYDPVTGSPIYTAPKTYKPTTPKSADSVEIF